MTKTRAKRSKDKNRDSESSSEEEITNNEIYKMLGEMKKSMDYMSAKFDEIQEENKELKKCLKETEKENKNLKERVQNLEMIIDGAERDKIRRNIIINGIEKQDREENMVEIVRNVMRKINVDIESNIVKCHRKDTKKENSPIVVELKTEKTKEEILKAKKNLGRINAKDCHLKGKNNEIFINEQLTKMMSTLFYSARELKKEKKIKYVWTRDGNIYVRKTDTSQKIKIKTITDLKKIE